MLSVTNNSCRIEHRRILVKSLLFFFSMILFQESSAAQQTTPQKNSYESLLARVKNNDHSVDFKELRMAFTDTPAYSPYGGDTNLRKQMFGPLKSKEFYKTLEKAEKILAANDLGINGHLGAMLAHPELGRVDNAPYPSSVCAG